jgi:glycerol uptake facilitator-like aquaporin
MMLTVSHHRGAIREVTAEFIGVALLVIFGAGAACQVVLSTNPGVSPSERGVSTPTPLVMPRDSQAS